MGDPPLTVLQLTHQGGPAGSTQSIFDLSRHLARRGHRVLVGCRAGTLLARLAGQAGLEVVPLDFTSLGGLARALAAVIRREGVEVVNSHATRDRRALAWLRWRGRLPAAFVVTRRTMPRTSPLELLAVDGQANQDKGDGDAATWLPPNKPFRCAYVSRQVAVKARYHLSVTPAERSAIAAVLQKCPGEVLPA